MKYQKIVLVCTDNTCLSIMAEAVMKSIRKSSVEIISRGLVVLFPEPMNPKAVAVLKSNDLSPAKENSEPLTAEDLAGGGVLVLTMSEREAQTVRESFGVGTGVWPLGAFIGRPADIVEPHGGTLADYGACYEYLDLAVKLAAEKIAREEALAAAEEEAEAAGEK